MAYLGKSFTQKITDSLDVQYMNSCRRGLEDIKLKILDAAEANEHAPSFPNMTWVNELWYDKPNYHIVRKEFNDWLSHNGLQANINTEKDGSKTLVIKPNTYTDFDKVPEPDLTSWLDKVMQPK